MAVKKLKNLRCPFCDGTEMVKGLSSRFVLNEEKVSYGDRHPIFCIICKNCGSIVREYMTAPEKLPDYQ